MKSLTIFIAVLVSLSVLHTPKLNAATTVNKSQPINYLGMIGWWTFDGKDLINNAVDRSGNGNTGNLTGFTSTTTVPGKVGQALYFDGTNDYVNTANFADDLDEMTVSVWFKTSATPSVWQAPIVSKLATGFAFAAGWIVGITGNSLNGLSNGTLYAWIQEDGGQDYKGRYYATSLANDGKWHHAVLVVTGGNTVTLYFDGSTSGTANASGGSTVDSYSNSSNVRIGTNYNSYFYNGSVDDVRIYNRALSAIEINQLYISGSVGAKVNVTNRFNNAMSQGLVGHWTLDGKDMISNVVDRSGQGNTGYLKNFTSTTTIPGKLGQALSFDGSNDGILLAGPTFGNNYTLSMWVYPTGFPESYNNLIGENTNNAWQICTATRKHCFGSSAIGTVVYSNTAINAYEWTHVSFVVQNGNMYFYTNGAPDGSSLLGTEDGLTATYIGKNNASEPYQGIMDDIRIYNRALSADEIKQLYNMGQ